MKLRIANLLLKRLIAAGAGFFLSLSPLRATVDDPSALLPQPLEVGAAVFRDGVFSLGAHFGGIEWHAAVYWFYDGYSQTHRVLQASGSLGAYPVSGERTWAGFIGTQLFTTIPNDFTGAMALEGYPLGGHWSERIIYGALFNAGAPFTLGGLESMPNTLWQGGPDGSGLGQHRCDLFIQFAYDRGLGATFSIGEGYSQSPKEMFLGASNKVEVSVTRPQVIPESIGIDPVTGTIELHFSEGMSAGTLDPAMNDSIELLDADGSALPFALRFLRGELYAGLDYLFWHDEPSSYSGKGGVIGIDPSVRAMTGIRHDVRGLRILPLRSLVSGEGIELRIHPTATDLAGNPLDGSNDGIEGGSFVFRTIITRTTEEPAQSLCWIEENLPKGIPVHLRDLHADADYDSLPNLMEYATGTHPDSAGDAASVIALRTEDGGAVGFQLTCRSNDPNLEHVCWFSHDGNSWGAVRLVFDGATASWSLDGPGLELRNAEQVETGLWELSLGMLSGGLGLVHYTVR